MTDANAQVLRIVEQGDAAYKAGKYQQAQHLCEQALDIAKRHGTETNYIHSCLVKIYKKNGQYTKAYEISKQALPTPAAFRDCAICLRKMAKEAQKNKQALVLSDTLNELYRLAVLAYLCYGTHDCDTGVPGWLYDRAVAVSQRFSMPQIQATYPACGKLEGEGLLTKADYKLFGSVFGETERTYNPNTEFRNALRKINKETTEAWLAETQRSILPYSREEVAQFKSQAPFAFND
jgi:tetratricopeptide (TPR) repeat protein